LLDFTTNEHRKFFAEFCRWELASGGPDPQLTMVAEMANLPIIDENERVWRALCYIAVYNVPYAEVLWRHWSYTQAENTGALRHWLDEAFEPPTKITCRNERKMMRRADWMAEYLNAAHKFVWHDWPKLKAECAVDEPTAAYELAWEWVLRLPRIGRYSAIKLLEYMRRHLDLHIATPDIRPKDAWSPRHTLGYLFPDRGLGNRDNSIGALALAHQSCQDAIAMLKEHYDVDIDMFQLQVMLCEYRESWESMKQYPGRSIDSELKYARQAEREWGHVSDIWRAREVLFPHKHLGELNGWDGPRKPVAVCLRKHGYTWTDLLYDFNKTEDMANPVRWQA
jgi:hypothetical protein